MVDKPPRYAMSLDKPMTVDQLIGILQSLRESLGGESVVKVVLGDDEDQPMSYDVIGFNVSGYRHKLGDDFSHSFRLLGGHLPG